MVIEKKQEKTEKNVKKPVISQKKPKFSKLKYKLTLFRLRRKNDWIKFKIWLKGSVDSKDKLLIKNYIVYSLIQGLFLNLALLNFGFNISLISVISWGSMLWMLETKLIKFVRRLLNQLVYQLVII